MALVSLPSLCAGLIVGAMLGSVPSMAAEDSGWTAYNAGHLADAVRLWRAAAPDGDTDAQFGLGIAYDLGQGVPADERVACSWYKRAGAAGHVAAAFNAAVMYDSGRCGARQASVAAKWYARAAGAGHPRAQFDLAQMYASGDGVPTNPELAAAWFRAAASNGLGAASGRSEVAVQPDPARPLLPVVLVDGSDAPAASGGSTVLVWSAPEQPERVRYFVEVSAIQSGSMREVLAQYVDVSALQVSLPNTDKEFAWRVITVGVDPARYVPTPWQRLPVRS